MEDVYYYINEKTNKIEFKYNNRVYHKFNDIPVEDYINLICESDTEFIWEKNFEGKDKIKKLTFNTTAEIMDMRNFNNVQVLDINTNANDLWILRDAFYFAYNFKELIYKGVSITSVCRPKFFSTTLVAVVHGLEITNIIPEEKKKKIIKALEEVNDETTDDEEIGYHETPLEDLIYSEDGIKFLNEIYYPRLGARMLGSFSAEIKNSTDFYEFMKDKKIDERGCWGVMEEINNPNMIRNVLPIDYVICYLNKLDPNLYDADLITYILNKKTDDIDLYMNRCYDLLKYFKDNKTLIGLFANKVKTENTPKSYEEINKFLESIKWAPDDTDTIYWLCSNNIHFMFALQDISEYLLILLNSYDVASKNDNVYNLVSSYNKIEITKGDCSFGIKITDNCNREIEYNIDKSNLIYNDIMEIINEIKEQTVER